MKKLTDEDLDNISKIAVSSAETFIFSRVSKKEIIDIDINVELVYNESLDVDVSVNIIFDDLSSADFKIADEAADYAVLEIEKLLK
ncbi:MAG: DUF3194 domain-containing protein [Methanobacterium sp.]|uniref:DUF3194 domain-containing protein n=1 Tax=Methanobacterium sp. TaxID=2164 RepID=UPI003D65851E|nr:DUF3194 domain-containing protein [Methanobacterium sp.]